MYLVSAYKYLKDTSKYSYLGYKHPRNSSLQSEIVRGESEHSTATSKARSTAKSLLPAKPDCQRGESEHSTATSLLPAKPDPPLRACSQQSQIVRGESEHSITTSEARPTATSEARLSEVRASIPPLTAKPDPLLPAKPDCQR